MPPKITIITTIHNAAPWLDACVRSVLAQSFADWELLLIDDGSTDSSPSLCDQWAERDARIRVFHQANAGVSVARNTGLDNAQGEWISFLDADDCFDPDFLSALYEQTVQCDADISFCDFRNFTGAWEGEAVACPGMLPENGFGRDVILGALALQLMRSGCRNTICTKLFRRDMIEPYGLRLTLGLTHGEDREFLLRCLAHCRRAAYVPQGLYRYRLVAGSASNSLRHDSAERIWRQHQSDLTLFEALGVPPGEARLHCREGMAVEVFNEIWRLAGAKERGPALRQLQSLLRSVPMEALLEMPPRLFAVVFPGRPARIVRWLAARRMARLLRLLIRTIQ